MRHAAAAAHGPAAARRRHTLLIAPAACPTAGALEAAPAMGSADIILDLVSTGVTLRENNLKQIEARGVLLLGPAAVPPCCGAAVAACC